MLYKENEAIINDKNNEKKKKNENINFLNTYTEEKEI